MVAISQSSLLMRKLWWENWVVCGAYVIMFQIYYVLTYMVDELHPLLYVQEIQTKALWGKPCASLLYIECM
jgi:hypothetical protein